MSQKDYIEQVEGENELLKQKLDDALRKYDELYNDRDNLRERIREIDTEEIFGSVPVGVATKYKISQEALNDIRNMHGLDVGKFMKEYMQTIEDESYDV
jgi:predicted RNase H-like nuclease